ncbi:hypothetical protein ANRL3_02144 [Anaerolineae bacterium]|nr:hypothetical protein ANRL3_02144 [Anaerolineae bacterium]
MTDPIPNLVDYRIAKHGIPLSPMEASLYEYVMAGNGIFVRGARREFQTQFCIQPFVVRGLQELAPALAINGPHVPREIVSEMLRLARLARDKKGQPCEIVFHLELDESLVWQCNVPSQWQSAMRAKPIDDSPDSTYAKACIEVHSHVNMHAGFSRTDDDDEQGFRVYAVLGCVSTRPVIRVRVGLYGYRHDIPASWVFDLPLGIGDAVTGEGTVLGSMR